MYPEIMLLLAVIAGDVVDGVGEAKKHLVGESKQFLCFCAEKRHLAQKEGENNSPNQLTLLIPCRTGSGDERAFSFWVAFFQHVIKAIYELLEFSRYIQAH